MNLKVYLRKILSMWSVKEKYERVAKRYGDGIRGPVYMKWELRRRGGRGNSRQSNGNLGNHRQSQSRQIEINPFLEYYIVLKL